jgi:hypothetical protein
MRAKEFINESHNNEVEDFLFSLGSDDVGVEEIGPYRIHFEGFSDWCQQDAQERCDLPSDDPRHLPSYEAVYDEVLNDFIKREGGKQPIDSGLTGDEDYPVFYAIFNKELDEMALPADWDPTMLGHDKTFKSRLEYAKERAERLGGGSSRVAFIVTDNGRPTALKIAKNRKGMAQNEAEVDVLTDGYVGKLDIVIPLIDYDKENPQPTWLQTEVAKKVSRKRLEQMLFCDELEYYGLGDFMSAVSNILGQRKNYMPTIKQIKQDLEDAGYSDSEIDIFMEYATEVATLVSSTTVLIDDLYNVGNWGEFNGRPVIIDLGYTEAVKPLYMRNR